MIFNYNQNNEVVALLGAGSMGIAIVERIAANRTILLGDISEKALAAASEKLRFSGYAVETMKVDASDKESIEAVPNSGYAYVLAKRANQLRVRKAAIDWGQRGARINTISPGIVVTPLAYDEFNAAGEGYQEMIRQSAMHRVGNPAEIAAAAEFLLSDKASFITGTDLLVDGGTIAAIKTGAYKLTLS